MLADAPAAPAVDAAPSPAHVLLDALPPELLSRLLGFVPECWYTAQYRAADAPIPPDATHSGAFVVLLPAAATVCTAFRRALLSSSKIALSLSGMRPPPHDWLGIVSIAGARRSLRPDVLAIYDCNLKPEILAGLLRAQPLSVISIRRCHSLSGSETLDTLPTGGTVRALMYAGLSTHLGAVHALELRRVRVLSLVDCRLRLRSLLARLPAMPELRCLLLGGALVEEELEASAPAGDPPAGNPAAIAPPALALGGAGAAGGLGAHLGAGDPLATTPPVGAGGPLVTTPPARIGLVETTWQTDSVRAALRRACPGALQLDLCEASSLEASLGRLSSLLDTSLAEHGGHVASAALAAALNCRNGRRSTPLHQAAHDGAAGAAELLLAHGAHADAKDVDGCTPLHRAVWYGCEAVVAALLRAAEPGIAPLTVSNHAFETPLYLAALRGHLGCVHLLLQHAEQRPPTPAARPPAAPSLATTPAAAQPAAALPSAADAAATAPTAAAAAATAAASTTAVGTAAAPAGASLAALARVADHDGYTPLHAAVIGRAPECAALLVEHGFDCNATNRYLQTPLHLAARLGSYEAAQLLLGYGADPLRRDERNQQAWQVTERSIDRPELTTLLREATEAAQASHASAQGNGGTRATGSTAPTCRRARGRRRSQRTSAGGAGGSEATTV